MACAGEKDDFASFSRVNSLLLNTPSPLRNVPVRIYIPSSPSDMTDTTPGSLKVVQTLIPPRLPNRKCPPPSSPSCPPSLPICTLQTTLLCSTPVLSDAAWRHWKGTLQTLGGALKSILPPLFPSSRDPVLANVILHGGPVPFRAPLEELMREAAYPDGWLCLVVVLL
jgi:autophagy-related protein 5